MLDVRLLRPWTIHPARPASEHTGWTQQAARPARSNGRFAARDHRDDGSAIAGLIIGILVALPLWALVIVLLLVV